MPRKKVFKKNNSILPTFPNFFQGGNLNHTYFLIWPYLIFLLLLVDIHPLPHNDAFNTFANIADPDQAALM